MGRAPVCINPIALSDYEKLKKDVKFTFLADNLKVERANQVAPYLLDFEPLNKCAGSCKYCFSASTPEGDVYMSKEKVFELVDESYDLGARFVSWTGGDPLLHPNWKEFIQYAADKEMGNYLSTAGIISKAQAKEIYKLVGALNGVAHHLDTVNQEAYNRSHFDPRTMALKMEGYRNLLDAGFPPEKIANCITMTRPAAETVEETMDWLVDEMGAWEVMFLQYKPEGFGKKFPELEPGKTVVKKALEYRAKKLGDNWLRLGTGDADKFICRAIFGVGFNGDVVPCLTVKKVVGNIYEESLTDIMNKHRNTLFYNLEIKGFCQECKNSDICWGCRATAYHYTGDFAESDPKCFMNPDAQEYYLPANIGTN